MAEQNAQNQVIAQISKSLVNHFESETLGQYNDTTTSATKVQHFNDFYYI